MRWGIYGFAGHQITIIMANLGKVKAKANVLRLKHDK
jgi:hypothetical protein